MSISSIGTIDTNNAHTSLLLSDLAVGFSYPDLVGEFFAPPVSVTKQTDRYPVYYGDDENRVVNTARGPGGEFNEVEWGVSEDSYYADGHGLRKSTAWEVIANADPTYQEIISGAGIARRLKRHVQLTHEMKVKTLLTTSGNYASGYYEDLDSIAGHNFDDSGANGLKTLMQYISTLSDKTGGAPIVMGVTEDCWIEMLNDSNFKSVLSDSLLAKPEQMRDALGLSAIKRIKTQHNTADKGQTPTRTRTWGNNRIILAAQGVAGDKESPSAARTFNWVNPAFGGAPEGVVRVIVDEEHGVTRVQFARYFDVKLVGVNRSNALESAVLLDNVYHAI